MEMAKRERVQRHFSGFDEVREKQYYQMKPRKEDAGLGRRWWDPFGIWWTQGNGETRKLASGSWFGYRSLKLRRGAWAGDTEGIWELASVYMGAKHEEEESSGQILGSTSA